MLSSHRVPELRLAELTMVMLLATVVVASFSSRTVAQTNSIDERLSRLRVADVRVVAAQIDSLTDDLLRDPRIIGELVGLLDDRRIIENRMPPAGNDTLKLCAWYRILEMDASAVSSIAVRMRTLESTHAVELALSAISRIGQPDANAFVELMRYSKSADVSVRSRAIRALGSVGGGDATTVTLLAQFLLDDHPNVRWATIEVLSSRKDNLEPVLDSLINLLDDESDVHVALSNHAAVPKKLRGRVAELLADIGPAATSALPRLRELMASEVDVNVRVWAACAVCMISHEAPAEALDLLGRLLLIGRDDEYGGNDSALAIAKLGPRGIPLLDELERARCHRSSEIRWALVGAFFAVEPDSAVSRSLSLMEDEDELVAKAVIDAFSSRNISELNVIEAYVLALNRTGGIFDEPASSAVDALAELGSKAEAALPALDQLLHNSEASERLREKASLAIRRIRKDHVLREE